MREQNRQKIYQTYVTDMLNYILKNTAGGENRVAVERRYIEIVEKAPKKKEEEKEVTKEDIIARIRKKLS